MQDSTISETESQFFFSKNEPHVFQSESVNPNKDVHLVLCCLRLAF